MTCIPYSTVLAYLDSNLLPSGDGYVLRKRLVVNKQTSGAPIGKYGVRSPKFILASVYRAGIFKKSMGARHRGGIGFSNRPARLHRLAEFIPWNQCRGPINI
jgi:hypothetical protein